MAHASANPHHHHHVRSSDPSACCVSQQYCSSGRPTHAEAGMPAMVSVVDAIYSKNHSRKARPSLPAAPTACQRPRAHGAHAAARGRNNFHPRAHRATTRRLLATPRRLFLAPSLADRRSAELLGFVGACKGPELGRGALGGGSAPWEVEAELQEPAPARPEGEWGLPSLLGRAAQFHARRKGLMRDSLSPKVLALLLHARNMLTTPRSSPFRPHGSSFRHCSMLELPRFPVVSPGS